MTPGGASRSTAAEIFGSLRKSGWFGIGKDSAPAYLNRKEWLYRRVESIEFVGSRSLRRRISVDFEGPKDEYELPCLKDRGPADGRLVPLSVFFKWPPLHGFDLRGPHDEPISLYKRTTNKELDFGLLMGMVERLGIELDDQLGERLALLVAMNNPPNSWVEKITEQLRTVLSQAQPQSPSTGASDPDPKPEALARHREYIADTANLAAQLANSSILWAPLRVEPGCDSIVKFSYLDKYEHQSGRVRKLLHAFSWQDRRLAIPMPQAGQHTRYHVDVKRPESGIEFVRVQTLALPGMPTGVEDPVSPGGRRDERRPVRAGASADAVSQQSTPAHLEDPSGNAPFAEIVDRRIHIYHPARSAPSHRVYMQLVIAATREGFISQCAAVAVALAALMTVGYAMLKQAAADSAGFVVILAAIPLVLGYMLVRSEEPMEREGIIGVRLLAVLSGVVPIIGGLALVFRDSESGDLGATRPFWAALTLASWLIAIALMWSAAMAVAPRDALRRNRLRNIAAVSAGLCAVALIAANVVVSQPLRDPKLGFVLDHRAIVIVASAMTLVAASALHGFLEGVRGLAQPHIDKYTSRPDVRKLSDRVSSVAVLALGELWILLMTGAALGTLWQAMTLDEKNHHTVALDVADHMTNFALLPCALVIVVASAWLMQRPQRLRGIPHLLAVGAVCAAVPVVLRGMCVVVPGSVEIQSRVAWLAFAGWLLLAAITIRVPMAALRRAKADRAPRAGASQRIGEAAALK
jgi:hypothetical protein